MKNSMYRSKAFKAYVTGFLLSLIFTLIAWGIVNRHVTNGHHLYSHLFINILVLSLAILQLVVQLIFFLHLGREKKPRWNLQALLAAVGIIIILVVGSIWIMNNLNYSMMNITPSQEDRPF
jgi:cytochrome o ubiquinol oxidase operon protein cyoD